jgi:hypothetical protein
VGALRPAAVAAVSLAGVVVLILVLTPGSSPRHAPAGPPPQAAGLQFGANVGRLFNGGVYGPTQITAQLSTLHATGATLARSDAPWEVSEPQPPRDGVHRYDWAFDDALAAALAAHRLRWLPIIDYSTPWAQSIPGQDHSPPNSASDYAAYAAALAKRYGPDGSFWRSHLRLEPQPVNIYEIWNEPDSALFWSPKPDPVRYAGLYLRARDAIKAVEPGARVIVGGLSHPTAFMPALLSAAPMLAGQLDGIGIHPYGPNPEAVLANVRSTRAALKALRVGDVPLYITEFGWSTQPARGLDYLSESLRPAYLEQTLSALGHLACGVAAVVLYAWITPERNPSDSNDWFGISPPGGGASIDVSAFTRGLRAATARGPAISCG